MPIARQQFDADVARINEPTEYKTDQNIHPLNCGVCGQILYVDRDTFEHHESARECDLDNQFICINCEQEYEDQAYEQR